MAWEDGRGGEELGKGDLRGFRGPLWGKGELSKVNFTFPFSLYKTQGAHPYAGAKIDLWEACCTLPYPEYTQGVSLWGVTGLNSLGMDWEKL